jgi:acylphosphatase
MTAVHLYITGRVQGVGYRDWLVREARERGLSGWVRNVGDNVVEAIVSGDDAAVEACVQACRRGPPLAVVDSLKQAQAECPRQTGFTKLPSVPRGI